MALARESGTTSSRLLATVYTIPLEFPSNRCTENNGKDPDSVTYRMPDHRTVFTISDDTGPEFSPSWFLLNHSGNIIRWYDIIQTLYHGTVLSSYGTLLINALSRVIRFHIENELNDYTYTFTRHIYISECTSWYIQICKCVGIFSSFSIR